MSEFSKSSPTFGYMTVNIPLMSAVKEEKQEDLLADLQDISDSERKTSTAESSVGKRIHDTHKNFKSAGKH